MLAFIVSIVSCDDYDKWTSAPDKMLHFSVDTVDFETILTTERSSTHTLVVFNRNEAGLRISSIQLLQDMELFRVNVDGESLVTGSGSDYEIRRKDSIYVRIDCLLPELMSDTLTHYEAQLLFNLESGVQQSVTLRADGLDAIRMSSLIVNSDTTLSAVRPYLVSDSIVVEEGCTLTISEGVRIMFRDNGSMLVRGSLHVEGSYDKPVIFRGDRTDRMLSNVPYDDTPDRWDGVYLDSTSHDNSMRCLDLHSARYGIIANKCDISIDASQFREIAGPGLYFADCEARVSNSLVANTLDHCVSLLGGDCRFTFCSFLQYYAHSADRGDALHMANMTDEEEHEIRLHSFSSCLMMGYAEDVIFVTFHESEEPVNLLFDHCYLATPNSSEDERFQYCIFDADVIKEMGQQGWSVEKRQLYTQFIPSYVKYNFRPTEASPYLGRGKSEDAHLFPLDLDGNMRDALSTDAGCFSYKPKE